jgi:hypothetical protein
MSTRVRDLVRFLCSTESLVERMMIREIEVQLFIQRLKETRLWCASCLLSNGSHKLHNGNYKLCSPELETDDVEVGLGMLDWKSQKRRASVDSLANKRAHLLASLCSNRLLEDTGRVVAFMPDQSLFDGAAKVETEGFFDRNNVPAWDTWICYVQD